MSSAPYVARPSSGAGIAQHYAAATDEEEELAIALAISASLANGSGSASAGSGSSTATPAPVRTSPYPAIPTAAASPPSPLYPVAHAPPAAPPRVPPAATAQPSAPPPPAAPPPQCATPSPATPPPMRRMHPDRSKCAGCGKAVWMHALNALDRIWHPDCFACGFCSAPINEGGNSQFAIGNEDHWPYHMGCYKMRFHPVCTVCQEFVPAQPDGRVEYKEQSFWKETYCTKHAKDGTPTCCSCSRFQRKGSEFVQLSDGRHVCLVCLGSLVMDTRDAQPLYEEVLAFFHNMGMPHPVKAPFMLVDAFTLNEYSAKEGKDNSGGSMFHVRGLTLATVYQRIPTIMRTLGGSGLDVSQTITSLPQSQGSITCEVSAILVMYGLPRLLTGCIIAHELMHAWLRMKHVAGLHPKVEEGLCQLLAYVWLDNQANSLTDPDLQRLASYFAYQIREDTSEVYGDGFREAYDAFQQRGLTAVVNDVLRRGKFN